MSRSRRLVRTTTISVAATLALGTGWVGVGQAASPDLTSVTVFLKAPDPAALASLASAQGLSHAQRIAAVDQLLPTAAEHETAAQLLTAEGLTVTNETSWSVTAAGAGTTVTKRFGSRPALREDPSAAQQRAATGAFPELPTALRSVVTAAYPTSGGPQAFHHDALLNGTGFRDAYTAPGIAPDTGQGSGGTLTIATIQLAGWNESDLSTYASQNHFSSFSTSKDVTEVLVDGASGTKNSLLDQDGDIEVDLDQESILSTDPYAHQRPYFAPNTLAGYADALSQVLDDVRAGNSSIVALSTSWGQCEAETSNIATMDPILESLVAAGVTVFSSAGDSGIYDCSDHSVGVDYPASSPSVVGVGGSTLASVGSAAANDGRNWKETGWSCTSEANCTSASGGGGGGGESTTYSAPGYQSAINDAPFANATRRLVPDIAADANPQTGFDIYTSDPTDSLLHTHDFGVGGTSLAAPTSAALFTNALAATGAATGIGDIHQKLYSAYAANDGAFRDIKSGSNGAAADQATDPAVTAQSGYDTVSGLGAPLWPKILGQASRVGAPTLRTSIALTHPHSATSPRKITARWSAKKATGSAAVQAVVVDVVRSGSSKPVHLTTKARAAGSYSFTGEPGATYNVYAEAVSAAGAASTLKTAGVDVPIDDKQFTHHGSWRRLPKSTANAGSILTTRARGASARVSAKGRSYSLVVLTGPNRGRLAVYVGGKRVATIDLYRSASKFETIRIFGSTSSALATRTVTVRCLGTRSAASSGPTVDIDALNAIR